MIKHSGRTSHQLTIGRKDMLEDITAQGGTPRKTLTASWPDVPPAFLSHFARGYVDGDGSLFWHVNRSVFPIPRISICGTESFLVGMSPAIEGATGIPSPTIVRHSHLLWVMSWVGVSAKCLAVWLYEDSRFHLERKRALAQEFMEWWPRVYHPSFTTAPMRDKFRSYLPGQTVPGSSILKP
jgi:hypothetical protein